MRSLLTRFGRPIAGGYLAAAAGIGAATAARAALLPLTGGFYPFSLYYVVVLVSARRWGAGPGLLALALGGVTATALVPWPVSGTGPVLVGLAFYAAVGAAILVVSESNRRAVGRLRREVAERERAESALRDSEGASRRLADLMPQIVWTARPDGEVESFNGRFFEYTGLTPGEAPGPDAWRRIVHPEDLARLEATRAEALPRGGDFEDEFRIRRADGAYRWHLVRSVPVRDEAGRVARRFGTATDIDDRRRAEEALRESEEKYRCLAEGLPLFIGTADADGTYNYLNANWREFTGLDLDGCNRGDWIPRIHPDDRDRLVARWSAGIAAGRPFEAEYRIRRACDGAYRWHLTRATPLPGVDQPRTGWVVAAIDIHDRKEAEEALRRSEERFQLVTRATSDSLWDVDWTTRTLWWQEREQPLFGYRPDQIGPDLDTWLDRIHPEDRPVVEASLIGCIGRREPFWVDEYRFRRADGTYADVLDRGCALYDADGRCTRLVGAMTDLTERKRVEAELRRSEEHFRLLADSIPQLAWMAGPDGSIFWFNRRWYDYTGTRPEQMLGWGWQSVHDPAELPRVLEGFTRALAAQEPWEDTFPLRRHDGAMRWHLSRAMPLRDAEGRIVRWFGTNTDITDRMQLEEVLREADRRKDEFLATLAHELRNPLVPIRNALPVLDGPGADDPAERAAVLATVGRQVRTMSRLIDDLMDVSRITRGTIELHPEPVELGEVVRRAVDSARPTVDERGHTLDVRLPARPILTEGDPTRLEQVIWNLLNNAAKYTEPGGRIAVELERAGDGDGPGEAVLTVRDTGIGLDAATLAKIFGMFVQAESGPGRSHDGLGIGLGLVRALVELHGGTISAESPGPGRGSTFAVRLPIRRPADPAPASASPTVAAGNGAGPELAGASGRPPRRRVLVVDDNPDVAISQARLLRRLYGQEVEVVHDGPSALEAARAFRPDLILLDLGMPGMDGHEVARRLRREPGLGRVRLVAITGWGQEADRRRSREAGFDDHLVKPVEPEALLGLLREPDPESARA